MTITAYPLAWPSGWPRSGHYQRKRGLFGTARYGGGKQRVSIQEAIERVRGELLMMGLRNLSDDMIVSTNLRLNLSGLPRGDQGEPTDPGAAVYWQMKGKPMRVMAIDQYNRVADNLAAIAATLGAMRAIDRHGGAQILDRAFTGFTALPPQSAAHWAILGLSPGASEMQIRSAWRQLSQKMHPDVGGSTSAQAALNAARDAALREIGA